MNRPYVNPIPGPPMPAAWAPERAPENPIPGEFNRYYHKSPIVYHLLRWSKALGADDQGTAAAQGSDLLREIMNGFRTEQEVNLELAKALEGVMKRRADLTASGGVGGLGLDALNDKADAIDWYDPDPNFFYALDKRSGAELAAVLDDLRNRDRYIARGAKAPTRLLFIGEPGNGKTVGGLWLGSQLGMKVALVRIDGAVQSAVGGTAKKLRDSFEAAQDEGAILFIDEFEAVAVPRNNQSANVGQWNRETTSALLQLLDSLPKEQIVIGATNHLEMIDSAIQRRMWKHVFFHPPDRDTRAEMLKRWWSKAPHKGDAKRVLLDLTEGRSGDFLERASEEANRTAARRGVTEDITVPDIEAAVRSVLSAEGIVLPQSAELTKVAQ